MRSPEALAHGIEQLGVGVFSCADHRLVFIGLHQIHRDGVPVSCDEILRRLPDHQPLTHLVDTLDTGAHPKNFNVAVKILTEGAMRLQLIAFGEHIARRACDGVSIFEVLDDAEQRLQRIMNGSMDGVDAFSGAVVADDLIEF